MQDDPAHAWADVRTRRTAYTGTADRVATCPVVPRICFARDEEQSPSASRKCWMCLRAEAARVPFAAMERDERQWLLNHLHEQAEFLSKQTAQAREHPNDARRLLAVRDEIFTTRETLETLEVPLATASNDEWNVARGRDD